MPSDSELHSTTTLPSATMMGMEIREDQESAASARLIAQDHSSDQFRDTSVSADMVRNWQDAAGLPLLPDDRPVSTVRDSLYDFIPLGPREEKLISTSAFLRLQQVKQLGFVYRVWPGATHTRYEHSLGSYNLMLRALRSLLLHGKNGGLEGISASSVQAMVVAALLHDIGHYPYSHTIEELGGPIIKHEQVGRQIIENGEIATIIEQEYHLSPERVADFVDPPKDKVRHPDDELLSHLLSGALDVDKLDYLPRDARACNVPYGGVDVARLIAALRVHPTVHNQRGIVVTHKGISPLHSLLHARQEMFDNIYWHHTSRAMQVMLVRAVQDALSSGSLHTGQLMNLDDSSLLVLLADARMPTSARALANDLVLRRPYKVALEISRQAGRLFHRLDALFWDSDRRRGIEQALARELSAALDTEIADHEILFDIPRPEKWEMNVWIWFAHPPVGMDSLMTWVEVTGLQSDDLARYELHQRRVRLVVPERLRAPLQTHRHDVLLPTLDRVT